MKEVSSKALALQAKEPKVEGQDEEDKEESESNVTLLSAKQQQQIKEIKLVGFTDEDAIIQAIVATSGDVEAAVRVLLD